MSAPRCFVVVLGLLLVACPPSTRTRLGEERSTVVEAPTTRVATYDTAVAEGSAVEGGGDASGVERAVLAAAEARGVTLTGDSRLASLTRLLALQLGPGGEPPPAEVIDFLAWNLGIVDPTPHLIVHGLPDRADAEAAVEASVTRFLERQSYTHWGAVVMPRNGLWLVVVTLSWRYVSLEPIARHLEGGATIPVRGSLAAGYSNPVVVVERPSGEVQRLPAGGGPDFDVRVPSEGSGVHQVEILARGPLGESVIANFPVYVGVEVPSVLHLEAEPETSGGSGDVASVRADLVRLANETRAELGLPALECDPRIDAVALAHSEDMRDHDFVGHQSPTTGTAADRVRAAGLSSGLVLENVGRGYSAAEIHRGLLASPGHRANLVNPDANVCGLGVTSEEIEGRTTFLATEVFLRFAMPIDVAAAPGIVLAAINRARTARGAGELAAEENLRTAAQAAADAFFADPTLTQEDTVNGASADLRRFAMMFRRVGGVMAVVTVLDEATTLEPTFGDDLSYVGIGVAQGSREDTGPNAIAVVIMLGWAR